MNCYNETQVFSSKRMGNNTYALYIGGVSSGTYTIYAGEWYDEFNGNIDVEQNKCEEISFEVDGSEWDISPTTLVFE